MTVQHETATLFSQIPFHQLTRLELLDDLRVRAPDILELKNHIRTMHGGMLYVLGEVAAAVAMAQLLVHDRASLFAITRQGEITYLKPARGAITSACQVDTTRDQILSGLESQRSVDVPVTVTLNDATNVVVAKLAFTWYVAPHARR